MMTKEEKETIICWDMADLSKADVYTCQPGIWRKLERMGYIAYDVQPPKGKVISKSFTVQRSKRGLVGIRPMRKRLKNVSRESCRGSFRKENSKKV